MTAAIAATRLLRMARRKGSLTRREVDRAGIHTQVLSRLIEAGRLERVGRGLYRLPNAPVTEHHGFALVAAAVPTAVVCLISALSFHEIGTHLAREVWIAIDRRRRRPSIVYPPIRVMRFGGASLTEGIETHRIEGETVRVYTLAKTLADVFKYRNKVGLEVVLEALSDAWRSRRVTMQEIDRYARVCRVEHVMRPYLEALVAV